MKDSVVLKRSMFSEKLPKSVRNSGIMAGFEDDDMLEAPPEEDTMPQMARTPQNPEILMNTLRGDMRSVDARYQELAQMVGEQAAQETPPEVLAMLQMQLGQQGGIGALPQGAGMMPPPMDSGAPMGAPGGAPAMPFPQGAMPPGMESAGPLPQGGADQAPPTPDGMPPLHAQVGAFVNAGTRAAQFLSPYVTRMGDKIATGAQELNAVGGRLMSQNAPMTFRPVFENVRGPMGRYTAEQTVRFPTATEHLANVFPKTTEAMRNAAAYVGNTSTGSLGAVGGATAAGMFLNSRDNPPLSDKELVDAFANRDKYYASHPITVPQPSWWNITAKRPPSSEDLRSGLERQYEDAYYAFNLDKSIPMPSLRGMTNEQIVDETIKLSKAAADRNEPMRTEPRGSSTSLPRPGVDFNAFVPPAQSMAGVNTPPSTETTAPVTQDANDPLNLFINQKLKEQADRDKEKGLSYGERVKANREEIKPLFDELMKGSKEEAAMNAMLLLADAGFKYASTPANTEAMAFAQAFQGLPKGLSSIVAQARDRQIKVDTASLEHAMQRVDVEDKIAREIQAKLLDYQKAQDVALINYAGKIDAANITNQGKGQDIYKQAPGGLLKVEDGRGNFKGYQLDYNSEFYKKAIDPNNPNNLVPSNPFVQDRGQTRFTPITNEELRSKMEAEYSGVERALSTFDDLLGTVQNAYGPMSAVMSFSNRAFVPFGAPLAKDTASSEAAVRLMLTRLKRDLTSSDLTGSGKQAVSELQEARDVLDLEPSKFFSSPEEAAKKMNTFRTMLLNRKQEMNEQLGFTTQSYRAVVPPSGTSRDPFIVPNDPKDAAYLYRHLGQGLAQVTNPDAYIYLKKDGVIKAIKPSKLTQLANQLGE